MSFKHPKCPWMDFAEAELSSGVHEFKGDSRNNPRIQEYFATVGMPNVRDEEHWCAAFVNWCIQSAGYRPLGNAWAAAWCSFGRSTEPSYGAIVAAPGHVGFLHHMKGDVPYVLGGNQSNTVNVSRTQKQLSQIRYRWPIYRS